MKKVINGKIYNTETAERIANWDNGVYGGDFNTCDETLYKTSKGAFFVHGEGGAMSRWGESVGYNGRVAGSGIEALTTSEALEWCENHGVDADTFAEHFDIKEA